MSDEEGAEEQIKENKPKGQQTKERCDLNNVEGHEPFEYEFLLKRVSDIVNEKEGGDSG